MRESMAIGAALVVLGIGTLPAGAAILCRKKNATVVVRDTACGKKETAIDLATLGVDAASLEGKRASEFAAAAHGHTGADLADESVGAAQLTDYSKTIGFPAQALNYDTASFAIDETTGGLRWAASFNGGAFLSILRPSDYAGGDVVLSLYFYPDTSTAGVVQFFARPRSYDPGDTFGDVTGFESTPVTVGTQFVVGKQTISLPAARLGKELWVVGLQRDGTGETYPDTVTFMGIGLTYTASR